MASIKDKLNKLRNNDNLFKSDTKSLIMKNYRIISLAALVVMSIIGYRYLDGYLKSHKLISNHNIAFVIFLITFLMAAVIVLKNIIDIISLVFGQKGQKSLTNVAEK